MSNQNFRAEIQEIGSRSKVTVNNSLARNSPVAKRPRDAPCCWNFCCHSNSLKIIRVPLSMACLSSC